MTDRQRLIEQLFHDAVGLPPAERNAYVTLNAPDADTAAEVMSLIAADAAPDAVFRASPDELALAAGLVPAPLTGRSLGPYRVHERIGQGGMGTVYRAVRDDLGSVVALKVVRGALGDPARVTRFRREQRVLARLAHPRIARLLDAGVADDDTPYLVMEYVEGEAITTWCDSHALDVAARLRLFLEVCDAVGFAHRNLVVHRDIKPSNVLVDTDGHIKLLDFGVARLLEMSEDTPALTATGARILSPEFAAPEQVKGEPITTATDVYGLGLLLRALLTETQSIPADLAAICQWALEEEPSRRYASVELLRDDIVRFLDGRPVLARLPTVRYRLGKFVRRHVVGVAMAAVLVLLLATGIVTVLWQARRASQARAAAEELSTFLVGMFEASDPAEALGVEITARDLLARGTARADDLDDRPEAQARLLDAMASAYLGLADYDRAVTLAERSLALERSLHGERHEDVAARMLTVGRIRYEQGRQDEATAIFRDVLALQRDLLGDSHDLTTGTMLHLVQALHRTAYDEAEALARDALAARIARHGPDHELIADALGSLAIVLWFSRRDLDAAETLLRDALAMRERLFGHDDPRVEVGLTPLSGFLPEVGKADEAEVLARRALDIRRRVYGDDHPITVHQLNNVAVAVGAQGRREEARAIYHEMIRRYEPIFKGDHPLVAIAINNLSATFYSAGVLDSAEHYLRQSLDMRLRLHDEVNADIALLYHNLGSLQRAQGRLVAAEQSLGEATAHRAALYGDDNPVTLRTRAAWADVLAQQGRLDQAEPMLRSVLEQQQPPDGEFSPDAARTMGFLAGALARRGEYEEAESLYRSALDSAERFLPSTHPRRRELVIGLSALYDALGRTADAARIRADAASLQPSS